MSSRPPSCPDPARPLARLTEALHAFTAHLQGEGRTTDAAFLAAHADQAEILEPLVRAKAAIAAALPAGAPPRYLGDFRIVRELGRGGMGVVFEAEQVSLRRRVALKVLPPHFTLAASLVHRFRREAAAAARIRHPGIVPIYAVGETDGTHWFAMELVDGGNLADVLARARAAAGGDPRRLAAGDLPGVPGGSWVQRAAEVCRRCALAVQAAHEQGVVHRDLKPHNILLDRSGEPRVVDFGLAKDLSGPGLTQSGALSGTPHYMSPEQALGHELDHRTDVYSLGVVLYELLALEPPFPEDSRLLAAIATAPPPPLRRANPDVPRALERVICMALAKDRTRRYPSAQALADDLGRWLSGAAPRARPPRPGRSERVLRAGAAAALLAAGTLWATSSSGRSPATEGPRRAPSAGTSAAAAEFRRSPRSPVPPPVIDDAALDGALLSAEESAREAARRRAVVDRELGGEVGSGWLFDVPAAAIDRAKDRGERLVMLKVLSVAPLRFVAGFATNHGFLLRDPWLWHPACSEADILRELADPSIQAVDLEPYHDAAGNLVFAAVLAARRSAGELRSRVYFLTPRRELERQIRADGHRVVDFEMVERDGTQLWTAVTVPEIGAGDAHRPWTWEKDVPVDRVPSLVDARGWQVVDLERSGPERMDLVLVGQTGERSLLALDRTSSGIHDFLCRTGTRLIELELHRTPQGDRFDGCTINASNVLTTRVADVIRPLASDFGFVLTQHSARDRMDLAVLNWEHAFDARALPTLWQALGQAGAVGRAAPGGGAFGATRALGMLDRRHLDLASLQRFWDALVRGSFGPVSRPFRACLADRLDRPEVARFGLADSIDAAFACAERGPRLRPPPSAAALATFKSAVEVALAVGAHAADGERVVAVTGTLRLPAWTPSGVGGRRYSFSAFVRQTGEAGPRADAALHAGVRELLRPLLASALEAWLPPSAVGEVSHARSQSTMFEGYPVLGGQVVCLGVSPRPRDLLARLVEVAPAAHPLAVPVVLDVEARVANVAGAVGSPIDFPVSSALAATVLTVRMLVLGEVPDGRRPDQAARLCLATRGAGTLEQAAAYR